MDEGKIKSVRLELCLDCQLSCKACPNANGIITQSLNTGCLSVENFIKFLNLNKTIKQIELSNWGEPFLNKNLLSILKIAEKKSITLNIENGSNLNFIGSEVIENLVKYKLNKLTCSIDGASNEVYKKYRVGGNLSIVIENINKINFFKKKYNSPFPKLTWQFIVFGYNQNEIELAQQLARDLNMDFNIRLNWKADYSPAFITEYLPIVSREQFYNRHKKNYKRDSCKQLWVNPQINWDGKILGCCNNFWQPFEGNAFENDLFTLLNMPEIKYSKVMLLGKIVPKPTNPCTRCKKYLDLKNNDDWLTIDEIYDC